MQDTYSEIWREIAGEIRLHLSADAFQRWFAEIELVQADEIALTFQVPNSIYRFWIESNYLNVVQSAAISVLGSPREVKYRAADSGWAGPLLMPMLTGGANHWPLCPMMRIRGAPSITG